MPQRPVVFSTLPNFFPIKQIGCIVRYDDSTAGFRLYPFSLWFGHHLPNGQILTSIPSPLPPALKLHQFETSGFHKQGEKKKMKLASMLTRCAVKFLLYI